MKIVAGKKKAENARVSILEVEKIVNYIMHSVKCAVLSFVLASGAGAMKIGDHFLMSAVSFLGNKEMTFSSQELSFPKGNHMGAEDIYAQMCQLGGKVYDDALKTGKANWVYQQNNKAQFQNIKAWMKNFTNNFVFSEMQNYEENGLLFFRNRDFFWPTRQMKLQESCIFRSADPEKSDPDDIILTVKIVVPQN